MHQTSRSLGLTWSELIGDRLFLAGLAIKFILIFALFPTIQIDWFVPFVVNVIEHPDFSPWSSFIDARNDPIAFPYGPVMLLAQLPLTFLGWLIDSTADINYFTGLGFRLSLLSADIFLLILLLRQFKDHWHKLMIHYWLSPLVIIITYWHGQIDLIPVVLFMVSIIFLKNNRLISSGVILSASIAAKHSMLVTIPFILLYVWFKNNNTKDVHQFILYMLLTFLGLEGLYLFDQGFQEMVLNNREIGKVFWLAISMSDILNIYILPLFYILLVYSTWRLRRLNFELLLAILGVVFSVLILLTPAPPGWFLWLTPILALHYSRGNGKSILLGALFSLTFVIYHFIYSTGSKVIFFDDLSIPISTINIFNEPYIQSLFNTLIIGLVVITALQIFRDGVKGSDYYHLGKKPLIIGISGAENSGKLNFSKSLSILFCEKKVLSISGENYFNWDKFSPMWRTVSPYNPRSSNIFLLIRDLRKIISGEQIKRREYSRSTGFFSTEKTHQGYQIVIVSGLHTFHTKQLTELQDVKFFLSNEKNSQKDEHIIDFKKYINSQKQSADIIFKSNDISSKNINLTVKIREGLYYQELLRVLIGICGLKIDVVERDEHGSIELIIQGEIEPDDIRLAANIITPNLDEFINHESGFHRGTLGLMQLVALMEIDEVLRRRKAAI